MAIYETFSKRQKRLAQAGQLDVFQYDTLPEPFRNQVIHIWDGAIGPYDTSGSTYRAASREAWKTINKMLSRELGVPTLDDSHHYDDRQCKAFLLKADADGALDIIELSFQMIDRHIRNAYDYEITQSADDAISELNHRFLEHGIGYEYVDGLLIRKDSEYMHAQAVKPALSLLQEQSFSGPEEEFMGAHEHYRKGRYKEAIADALKAFESTMKAICDARNWHYDKNRATAKPLIEIMLQQGLIPVYLQGHFTSLATVMEAGLPTLRNKTSGHGQGPNPIVMPEYFAGYALHLAASNIVFLVEAHKAMK